MNPTTEEKAPRAGRKPKATQAAAPDTRTGDLLAGANPPFDGGTKTGESSIIAVESSSVAVPDLAMMKPAEYVATIYQPFKDKFALLCAEADLVAVDEADFQRLADLQKALPEDQRRPVSRLNLTTKDGMATAIRLRAAFRDDVRLAAEKTREARKAPLLAVGKELDSQSKPIKEAAAAYEDRFDAAIKAEEKRKADEKAEVERIERERVDGIKAKITDIRAMLDGARGKHSGQLHMACVALAAMEISPDVFCEFVGEARRAVDETGAQLAQLYRDTKAREEEADRLAAEAEAQRLEAKRLKAEREAQEKAAADLAAQQAEQQRATAAVARLTILSKTEGTAAQIGAALEEVQAVGTFAEPAGALVQMAKDMAIAALESRHTAAVEAELNAAAQVELAPEPVQAEAETEPEPAPAAHDYAPIDWDAPAPLDLPVPAAAPLCMTSPLPESWSAADDAVTDADIIETVSAHYGWNYVDAVERIRKINFDAARRDA